MQKSLITLSILGAANIASAAKGQDNCEPAPPANCYADDCKHCYCLGPENIIANAPVRPHTCNGDWVISVAGFYWNAHQDGMEYAIDDHVKNPKTSGGDAPVSRIEQLNNIIDADYETPNFDWDFGFKVGLGYNTPCDGWDFGVTWTWYRGKANDHIEAEADDNHTLLPLWSAFSPAGGSLVYATDIETHWKLQLNLVDIELGREYWTSKYLSLRPFVGLRIAYIKQDFEIQHKGGAFSADTTQTDLQDAFNNEVDLDNNFKGVGVRAGFDTVWNFGCGWGIYGNFAAAIVYGRFDLDHDEEIRRAVSPHDKIKVLETKESFRASRGIVDLALGIQWRSLFCDCQYGFTIQLGWEHHIFFHQNQMWRVNRIGDILNSSGLPNDTGENVFFQRRGTLEVQGVTLRVQFEF